MRIAVISDIHGAAAPFAAALAAARAGGFDQLVLLGDLFTYGVDPAECADLAAEAIERDGAILVGGNHDQLYVDLAAGDGAYFAALPDWIRESVEWTHARLGRCWPDRLGWVEEWACDGVLFAHANPYGFGDWTYLSDPDKLARAATVLAERGFSAGVFGHLHRRATLAADGGAAVHVVGSIGQPRSREQPCPEWAMVDLSPAGAEVTARPVPFDAIAHKAAIHAVPDLSEATKQMLCRYFT